MIPKRKAEHSQPLGLTPVAFWCCFPLITIGIASLTGWLFKLVLSFFR
ncbi:MAG: hypothetical protein N2A42_12610 [Luteolibacter sp.]